MTPEQLERKRAYDKKWKASPKGKESHRKYMRKVRAEKRPHIGETQLRADAKRYGIDLKETYAELIEKQGGKCACCGCDESKQKRKFSVDHEHDTGKVRGLLCTNCNTAIGKLGDDLQGCINAVNYLIRAQNG